MVVEPAATGTCIRPAPRPDPSLTDAQVGRMGGVRARCGTSAAELLDERRRELISPRARQQASRRERVQLGGAPRGRTGFLAVSVDRPFGVQRGGADEGRQRELTGGPSLVAVVPSRTDRRTEDVEIAGSHRRSSRAGVRSTGNGGSPPAK